MNVFFTKYNKILLVLLLLLPQALNIAVKTYNLPYLMGSAIVGNSLLVLLFLFTLSVYLYAKRNVKKWRYLVLVLLIMAWNCELYLLIWGVEKIHKAYDFSANIDRNLAVKLVAISLLCAESQ